MIRIELDLPTKREKLFRAVAQQEGKTLTGYIRALVLTEIERLKQESKGDLDARTED